MKICVALKTGKNKILGNGKLSLTLKVLISLEMQFDLRLNFACGCCGQCRKYFSFFKQKTVYNRFLAISCTIFDTKHVKSIDNVAQKRTVLNL